MIARFVEGIKVSYRPSVENPAADTPGTPAWFGRFSARCSVYVGSRWAFFIAILIIAGWAAAGPIFRYSDTWQLIINTGTTIVTFLMVFLIQNTQNRDAKAINLKLNELIHAISKARNQMIDIENLTDAELDVLVARYQAIRDKAGRTDSEPIRVEAITGESATYPSEDMRAVS
jgi:low affinity Fe/Cu permease